jgi:RNA polymerase sigma-70 factor (ECF subfamily)
MEVDLRHRRLEALYVAHADAVYAYARRRAGVSVAEDVVMEVFVIACRRLDDVPDPALPWRLGCARRVLANQRRSAIRAEALGDRLREVARSAGVDEAAAGRLADALDGLGQGDREIILLNSWDGLDLRELALTLGCSRGAAAVRLHRARGRLRQTFDRARSSPADPQPAEATG